MQSGHQHGYPDSAAAPAYPADVYEQLSRLRAMSPPGAALGAIKPGTLLQPSFNSISPTGYSKALGNTGQHSNSSSNRLGLQHHSLRPGASGDVLIATHKGIYSPILEEQSTITESCSWTGSVETGRSTFLPEHHACSTPVSPEPRADHAAQQQPRWLRNMFRLAAFKAMKTSGRDADMHQQHQQQQQQQHPVAQQMPLQHHQQQQQQGHGQPEQWQQQAVPPQQQQNEQRVWWKPRRRTQQDMPYDNSSAVSGAVSPAPQCYPHAASPQSQQQQQQQQVDWSAQQVAGFPQPHYSDQPPTQLQHQAQLDASTYHQPQYQQQQQMYSQMYHQQQQQQQQYQQQQQEPPSSVSLGPFAQATLQQAVLAGATAAVQSSGTPTSPASGNGARCEGGGDVSQVVNVNSGQVLKVTSGEFQDILTVMQALADARKTLAVKLKTPGDKAGNADGAFDVVAAAAAKMAAAAAAAAGAATPPPAHRVPSTQGTPLDLSSAQHAAVQHQQPIAAAASRAASSSNVLHQQQEEQQWDQQQQQLLHQQQRQVSVNAVERRQEPAEGEPESETAQDCMLSEGHRVYSCTSQGLVPDGSHGSNLQGASQLSVWLPNPPEDQLQTQPQQQQQQQLWTQGRPDSNDSEGSTYYTVTNTTRGPTGEQVLAVSGLSVSTGQGGGNDYSTDSPDTPTDFISSSSSGMRSRPKSRQDLQQDLPETPQSFSSVQVHAPASCAGSARVGSTTGMLTHRPGGTSTGRADTTNGALWGAPVYEHGDERDDGLNPESSSRSCGSETYESCESPLAAGRAGQGASSQGKARTAFTDSKPEAPRRGGKQGRGSSGGSCSSNGSAVSTEELSQQQLELHHTGWTDDDTPQQSLGCLREKFNSPRSPREQRGTNKAHNWEDLEAQLTPRCNTEHKHLKNLYRKVGELETGLVKLLSGSLITPAAAAALISSLNKIAASGVVKSLSSGGGGASAGGAPDNNKLIETIQKAAMAAAAASSNGGAQPFAGMHMRLLASSIGSKKLIGRGSTCSSTTGQLSSLSGMESTKSIGSSSAGCATGGGGHMQRSIAGANKEASQPAAAAATSTPAPAPAHAAANPAEGQKAVGQKQDQEAEQQATTAVQAAACGAASSSVAMAMEVLAKAEERLKELHVQEERLKAFLAARESHKAPAADTSSKASEQQRDAAGPDAGAPAALRGEFSNSTQHFLQHQQRKLSGDGPSYSSSRRVSFCEDRSTDRGQPRSGNGKHTLLSPQCSTSSEFESPASKLHRSQGDHSAAARRRRMLECGSHNDLRSGHSFGSYSRATGQQHSRGGAEEDAGCWSDDSEAMHARRLLRQQRRTRQQLKQQRSAGGNGCGYESADESVSQGGAYSEEEQFENPGRYLYDHLRRSSLGEQRSYDNPHFAAAALHSAPVSSLHSTMSRRQMLLSTVDPALERSLETVAAKAIAKVRAKSSAGKPHSFEARQVPAHMYENRYSSTVDSKLAAHRAQTQRSPSPGRRQGSYASRATGQPQSSSNTSTSRSSAHKLSTAYSGSSSSYSKSRASGAQSAVQQMPVLATSTRSTGFAGSRPSASASSRYTQGPVLSEDRSSRRPQATPGGLDTVSERHVLRSNSSKTLPSSLWKGYQALNAASSSSASGTGAGAAIAAGAARLSSKASGSYALGSSGYAAQLKGYKASHSAQASGSALGTHHSSTSQRLYPADSGSERDDGMQYLANLFTLKKASDTHARGAVAKQLEALSRSSSPVRSSSPTRSSSQPRTRPERSSSPSRDSYGRPNASRSHLGRDVFGARSSSASGNYSSGGGVGRQSPQRAVSAGRSMRSVSAERSRESSHGERLRSIDKTKLIELLLQRHSGDAGAYTTRRNPGLGGPSTSSKHYPAAAEHHRTGSRGSGRTSSSRRRIEN